MRGPAAKEADATAAATRKNAAGLRLGDCILGGGVLLLAVALLLGLHLLAKPGGEAVVTTPDGETVLSLNRPGTYAFAGKDGLTVQLAVEEGRIRFLSSGCPDKVCVRSGWLSRTGQTAACLPAGVVVRVQAADDAGLRRGHGGGMKGANAVKTASAARRAAQLGLWMALAIAISSLEGWLPTLPVPGAKPGLSNIATMYVLTSMGLPAALAVTAARRCSPCSGAGTAALMSLAGGVLSTLLMALCLRLFARHVAISASGWPGRSPTTWGSWGMAMLLLDDSLLYYSPWLLFLAVAAGTVTGLTLNLVMPRCGAAWPGWTAAP